MSHGVKNQIYDALYDASWPKCSSEWEIIAQLHRGNHIARIEIDMLGRRDVDIQAQWDNEYRAEEYTNKVIN